MMIATANLARPLETVSAASATPATTGGPRFTLDGSDELEQHLDEACGMVLEGVQSIIPERKLEALLLGGGYGRGQGGVLRTEAGDRPYNDLEFYVFLCGNTFLNERHYRAALHDLAKELTPVSGVEVEFKIHSLAKLRRNPVSMFYYDLMLGHRRLWGGKQVLAGCQGHREPKSIPLSEATRLLMNRCSGLLFAKARLQRVPFTVEDADFVGRNLAKAQLAFGDAVLTRFGRYHWSCRERQKALSELFADEDLRWLPEVRRHHAEGVEFKLHPRRSAAASMELLEQHAKLTALGLELWLWLESCRLNHPFDSARDYALSRINKCPETSAPRNRLVNVKSFGPSGLLAPGASRYPRERLFHALALLLWDATALGDPCLLQFVQRELQTKARSFRDLITAYVSLWRRFN
jgi:hypothetical protein